MPYSPPSILLSDATPDPEITNGAPGSVTSATRADHKHPRLTSTNAATLDGSGEASITFTRSFTSKPMIAFSYEELTDNPPVVFKIKSWTTSSGNYVGAVVKGYRAGSTTLTAVTVVGVSVAVGSQTVNPFNGSAAGVAFMVIALQAA